MGEDGRFKGIIIGLVLFTLFSWLILTTIGDFGSENGRSINEIGNGSLNTLSYEDSIDDISSTANDTRISFESGESADVDDITGIGATLENIINFATTPFNLIAQVLNNIFGVPELFTNVVLGLLSLVLIFLTWHVLRSGG